MQLSVILFLFAAFFTMNTSAASAIKRLPTTKIRANLPIFQRNTTAPILVQPPEAPEVTKIFRELEEDDQEALIRALNRDRCVVDSNSSIVEVTCGYYASCKEVQRFVGIAKKFASDMPIYISLDRLELVECPAIRQIADSIVALSVGSPDQSWGNKNSSFLKALRLDNLHNLNLAGHGIKITRDSLSHFKRLALVAIFGSIDLIENNAFENVPALNTLALDWLPSAFVAKGCLDECHEQCFSDEAEGHNMYYYKHLEKLHCSADYMWLRTWLEQRPYLTATKFCSFLEEAGEMCSLPGIENTFLEKIEPFLLIDCNALMKSSCNDV